MKYSELQQIIKEEIDNVLNEKEYEDKRANKFATIFLQTFYDMADHKITFDEATDKLFVWIKANFK